MSRLDERARARPARSAPVPRILSPGCPTSCVCSRTVFATRASCLLAATPSFPPSTAGSAGLSGSRDSESPPPDCRPRKAAATGLVHSSCDRRSTALLPCTRCSHATGASDLAGVVRARSPWRSACVPTPAAPSMDEQACGGRTFTRAFGRKHAFGPAEADAPICGGAMTSGMDRADGGFVRATQIGDRVESRSRGAMVLARKTSEPDSPSE
jgi:hypothetical protein